MPRHLEVHLLPQLVAEDLLRDGLVVAIDVLRATTTIVHALVAGAKEVVPCVSVDDARDAAARFPSGEAVLGGERGGKRIDGFDLGNSPEEYTPEAVGGRIVIFSTTNGTKALLHCRQAAAVLVGAFSNLLAVCRRVHEAPEPIHLVCAGTDGEVTREDALLAGTIVHLLLTADRDAYELNDQAHIAADAARQTLGVALAMNQRDLAVASIYQVLQGSRGGKNLIELGMERDLIRAAQLDLYDLVPELDLRTWTIRGDSQPRRDNPS
jgi:2-phosphosulfolactate phosphatase